jgi:hypothetical protein
LSCWFLGTVALQWLLGLGQLGLLSRGHVLASRVRLVGVAISFEKNFYRLPFTPPPLWRQFRSFTLAQVHAHTINFGLSRLCHLTNADKIDL